MKIPKRMTITPKPLRAAVGKAAQVKEVGGDLLDSTDMEGAMRHIRELYRRLPAMSPIDFEPMALYEQCLPDGFRASVDKAILNPEGTPSLENLRSLFEYRRCHHFDSGLRDEKVFLAGVPRASASTPGLTCVPHPTDCPTVREGAEMVGPHDEARQALRS
jgi:hypothetical protein